MLMFDTETAKLLATAYVGADFVRRRRASFDALDPRPAETILDIGCGNGLLTLDLARAVGPKGRVIGIDPSEAMRAEAEERCAELPGVSLHDGTADTLPVADAEADKAVSIQVFEYINDVPGALEEAHRALRPGGRLVLGDMHFGTLVWASDDPERMARMIAAWDHHAAWTDLPAALPALMRQAHFEVLAVTPLTIYDTVLRPDGLARMMLVLMRDYATNNGHVSAEEADDWLAEQEARADAGNFFFSLNHYIVTGVAR